MSKNTGTARLYKYGVYSLYLGLTLLCAYCCFARLNVGLIQHWDEARHGVNAYEMLKNHNYIVNTYNYQNDYFNLKPPLSYWGILLGFKLFGINVFGMRFYSALSFFGTFLMVAIYLHRRYGKAAALTWMLLFLSFYDLFFWHAGRHADADALYLFLFTAGCLSLMESPRHPALIWLCGLSFSLGFLAKSWHAFVLLPIGGLFYLFAGLYKKLRTRHYLLFFLCALLPIALWVVARYSCDGMDFLGQMFSVDVTERIAWSESSNPNYLFFLGYLWRSSSVRLILLILFFGTLFCLLKKKRPSVPYETVLALSLWILVPLSVFSLSHTYYFWYIYPIFPALGIAAAVLVQKCTALCEKRTHWILFASCMLLPLLLCLRYDRNTIQQVEDLEVSGFQMDLAATMEQNPDLHGMRIYVEKNNNEYKDSFYWEQSGLLMAELSGDLKCEEGGVKAFLQAPSPVLLIVDPYYYDVYRFELKDLKVVYQNEYLILCRP